MAPAAASSVAVAQSTSPSSNDVTKSIITINSSPKGTKMRVSDFVSTSFAKFEAEYGPSTPLEASAETQSSKTINGRHERDNTTNNVPSITESVADHDYDEKAQGVDPLWLHLLTLYSPLLLFGLRRSTIGTFSFLRTFLLGHIVKLIISVAIFSVPTTVAARVENWWRRVIQTYWVQYTLWSLTGEERFYPNKIHYRVNNDPEYSTSAKVTGNLSSTLGSSCRKGGHPDHVWPPRALTVLALITLGAFVVHPDGLTWIMLGTVMEGFVQLVQLCTIGLLMLKNEPIHTLVAFAALAGIVLFGGLIHRTISPKVNRNFSLKNDSALLASSRKNKKGKKGKNGRHGHHTNSRGRGKVRGGHFRSTKDLLNSPTRERSRSRSRTKIDNVQNDTPSKSHEIEPFSCHENINIRCNESQLDRTKESCNSVESSSNQLAYTQSQYPETKCRPYSVDSSLPQLSDDISSCSSIAGSLIDIPGSKQASIGFDETDNSARRTKSKLERKDRTDYSMIGIQSKSVSSSSVRSHQDFKGKNAHLTSSQVTPLIGSSSFPSFSSTVDGTEKASITPVRKAVSRPMHPNSNASSLEKCSYSAQIPSNFAFTKKSTLSTSSFHEPTGVLHYGLPNYTSYAQNDGRYAPGKIELAAFLTQVGLVGAACADLLADLSDVDALAALSPGELYSYNIRSEKQLEIAALLNARQLRMLHQRKCLMQRQNQPTVPSNQNSMPTSVIRPPPGLGFSNSAAPFRTIVSSPNVSASPFMIPAPPVSSDFLSPSTAHTGQTSLDNNFTSSSFQNSMASISSFNRPVDYVVAGTQRSFESTNLSGFVPISSTLVSRANQIDSFETEDEKIDADLRQLGDRMVGSILDF